jgi:hypothetical protein
VPARAASTTPAPGTNVTANTPDAGAVPNIYGTPDLGNG